MAKECAEHTGAGILRRNDDRFDQLIPLLAVDGYLKLQRGLQEVQKQLCRILILIKQSNNRSDQIIIRTGEMGFSN